MKRWLIHLKAPEHRGQSLVEVALFLPILIFMLVGIVEVSTMLNTQNKVSTAGRLAAGYGASNMDDYDRRNWALPAPTAVEMGQVALNSVTQTLELDPDLWDMWQIRAVTNDAGDAFEVFTYTHTYGNYAIVSQADWDGAKGSVEADMLDELQSWPDGAKNLEVVASSPFYAQETVLGVKIWQWVGLKNVQGLTVMRVGQRPPFTGCPLLPITIRRDQFSLYPSNWPVGVSMTRDPNDPVVRFPPPNAFDYPDGRTRRGKTAPDPPVYELADETKLEQLPLTNFPLNRPGIPFDRAQPGYLYFARENPDETRSIGAFGWLNWRADSGAVSQSTLAPALDYPGSFVDLDPSDGDSGYKGGEMDLNTDEDPPCNSEGIPPGTCGNGDGLLDIGEWVSGTTGNINSSGVGANLQFYPDTGTETFLVVYDNNNGLTGANLNYQIYNFAKVKILGWHYGGNLPKYDPLFSSRWMVFEFVSWGSECVKDEDIR